MLKRDNLVQVGDPQLDCSKRWKQLRDRYVRESQKTKEKKSGEEGSAYVSCWPLFQLLTCLEPTVKHRKLVFSML